MEKDKRNLCRGPVDKNSTRRWESRVPSATAGDDGLASGTSQNADACEVRRRNSGRGDERAYCETGMAIEEEALRLLVLQA